MSLFLLVGIRVGSTCGGGMHQDLSGCGGSGVGLRRSSSAISRVVSVAIQKNGGDLHHPICRLVGTTMTGLSLGEPGKT